MVCSLCVMLSMLVRVIPKPVVDINYMLSWRMVYIWCITFNFYFTNCVYTHTCVLTVHYILTTIAFVCTEKPQPFLVIQEHGCA